MKKWLNKIKYLLIFIIIESAVICFLYDIYYVKEKQYFSKKTNELQIVYNAIVNCYSMISQTIFGEVINKPDVIEIFKSACTADSIGQIKIRNKLYQKLYASYKNLNKNNYVNFHFQLPNSVSFLRFYKPEKSGDDLSSSRYSIKTANQKKIPVQGFETGYVYHGYRFIYPLFYENTHIGSVEIGISYEAIKKEMERIFFSFFDFIINKNILGKNICTEEKNNYTTSNLSDEYVIEKSATDTGKTLYIYKNGIKKINYFDIKEKISGLTSTDKPFALTYKINEQNYILSFLPVFNFEKTKVAYLISYTKDDTIAEYHKEFLVRWILITALLLAFSAFFIYFEHAFKIIKQSRDELQSISNNMTEGIIVLDRNHKIISVNPATEKITGLYEHELKGRELSNIINYKNTGGTMLSFDKWPVFDNINYGLSYKSDSDFFIIKNQKEITIELTATSRFQKGKMIGYLIICRKPEKENR